MRILVIQTAFIGDVALTTVLFRALQSRFGKNAAIHVVTTPQGRELLAGLSGVTAHALDKKKKSFREGLAEVRAELGREPFDLVVAVHRSLRSLWLGRTVNAKRRIAYRSFWSGALGYETVNYPEYSDDTHYVDKVLKLLEPLGQTDDGARPDRRLPWLAVQPNEALSARDKLARLSAASGYIVLSPFSVWGTKMWFADRFAQLGAALAKTHGLPIVIIGSPTAKEKIAGATIAEKIAASGGRALSLAGETTIGELKEVIRGAALLVANDSAPVHIAAAFEVPTVAIFGPTVRKWGFFPLSARATVVERLDVACRPCHVHGPERCPQKHFKCMDQIEVADVAQAVENLMRHA